MSEIFKGMKPSRRSFLRRDELEGRGRLRVRLQGPTERPVLRASGGLADLVVANITAPRVELERAEGAVVNKSNLALTFVATEGLTLSGTPFSRADGTLSDSSS